MKRNLLTGLLLLVISTAFSQTTFYWVGGATGDWTAAASWNTQLDGSGSQRTTPNTADVLIFSGTGNVTPVFPGSLTIGQLQVVNSSSLTLRRNGAATGTSTLTIAGDGVSNTDDLLVSANSSLILNATVASYSFVLQLGVAGTPATGTIYGTASVFGTVASRFGVQNAGSLQFASGSTFYSNLNIASNYPFGGSISQSADRGVSFNAGSTLVYQGGNSVFGNTSTFNPIVFETGSTLVFEAAESAGIFGSRTFANIVVRPLASAPATPVTVTVNGTVTGIDSIFIQPNATFQLASAGVLPVLGSITNNGTFGTATVIGTSNLLMVGSGTLQTIGGTGTFNAIGALSVGTDAKVRLDRPIVVAGATTSSITGILDVQGNTITGSGNFQLRSAQAASTTATVTSGSNSVTAVANYASSNIGVGLLVTGPAFAPNTYIIGTNSGASSFTLSKPALITAAGTAVTTTGNAPTLSYSNSGGMDVAIATTGATRSFGSGTNYFINAATSAPFSTSSTNSANNITFNAPVTLNRDVTANGVVTLNSGKITIPANNTLRLTLTASLSGTDATKYFVTEANTSTGTQGALRIDNISTATTFPIGTSSNYMPAGVTPTTVSDFAAGVFEGITTEGTPNGTPFTTPQKQTVVDAVWNVTRINGTGDAVLTTSWPQSLEGSTFSTQTNIGIMHHDGTIWESITGSGDNTVNTATATFSSFSPFAVAANTGTLPMNWKDVSASLINGSVKVDWKTVNDVDVVRYEVERSSNAVRFSTINNVIAKRATGDNVYSVVDASPEAINYYRIKSIGINGEIKYSTVLKVSTGKTNLQLYPNPAIDVLVVSGLTPKSTIKIVNMAGAVMQNVQPTKNTTALSLSVSSLSKGMYMLQVISDNGVETKAFVKQ